MNITQNQLSTLKQLSEKLIRETPSLRSTIEVVMKEVCAVHSNGGDISEEIYRVMIDSVPWESDFYRYFFSEIAMPKGRARKT